jgi:alpha-L-arabinofuranosidase
MMSYGMGFHEYFQLCEDLGAEPVPVLYAGILCQARRDRPTEADYHPGTPEFNALIQDYLDLIEYATGDTGTVWGAKRAANGHPDPFNLKKIGIGNENWGANYWRNFDAIRSAVLAAYPGIKVITTTGPLASGGINDEAWRKINALYKDAIVDEHYYMEPDWFLANTRRYDSYLRNGVQIFVGEYAAHETSRANSWYAAMCEASYMTGLERNADIVKMASYAPLLAREGMFQWAPDMIWFDGGGVTNLTPSYHIQRLFSTNTGTVALPPEKIPKAGDLFHASSLDEQSGVIYTKLVNPFPKAKSVVVSYANADLEAEASVVTISGEKNSRSVSISEDASTLNDGAITVLLGPYTAAVIQVRLKTGPK